MALEKDSNLDILPFSQIYVHCRRRLATAISIILLLTNCGFQSTVGVPHIMYTTIYVDQSGAGNFTSIQAAIDNVTMNNDRWTRIYVMSGQYIEKVTIPKDKPFIFIQGQGNWNTFVQWNGHVSIDEATFNSLSDNLVVKDITFVNSYNYPPGSNTNTRVQAVAARVLGDKSSFYGVRFLGVQDTLWDEQGRHYFKSCVIEGAVDFIFGAGQSFYQECIISVNAGISNVSLGSITAQARSSQSDENGFVFKDCNITGNGVVYLGRAWRRHARVVFLKSTMGDIITPSGWSAWDYVGQEYNIRFSEYACGGPGADTSKRVSWEFWLTKDLANKYGNITFVDKEGWIHNQP